MKISLHENTKVQEKLQQKITQLDQEKAQDLENKKFIQESRQVMQSLQQNTKKDKKGSNKFQD